MTPDDRQQRNDLIIKLYRNGCTMKDISSYLGVSHGLVSLTVREDPESSSRPRGRPRSDEPPPPTPRQIMGDEYIPDFFTEAQKTKFILRLPGQPLQHPRATARVVAHRKRPRPDTVDFDPHVPIATEIGLSLDDPDEDPTPPPSSILRERIASVASRVDS